jgi:aspartate/methionine/tyrosine aminotransferase
MEADTFSADLSGIRMSPIVSISEQVRKRAPQFTAETGKQFILFQRGEIDFATPRYIREAAKRALDEGFTKYPKSGGEDILKDALIAKMRDFNGATGLTRENIVCTYGGQEALEISFKLFSGKRGAGFAPCWSCVLENFVPYAEIDFEEVPLQTDFSIDYNRLEQVLQTVDFFYLNTPQNPTGKVFTEEEIRQIAGLCKLHEVWLISDEAYERITYDGRPHFSPLALDMENIIGCYTFSKTYAMTGWRMGYLVTRNKEIPRLATLGDYTQTAGVVTFLQHAAAEAITNHDEEARFLAEMIAEFRRRRDALCDGLSQIPGVKFDKPEGAFYLFPNFTPRIPSGLSGQDRALYVYSRLMEKGVAVVYGSCFGKHFGDNVRFSFSTTTVEKINEGVQRVKEVFS